MKHLSNTKKEWSSSRQETRQLKTDETLSVHKLPVVLMGLERYSVIFFFLQFNITNEILTRYYTIIGGTKKC